MRKNLWFTFVFLAALGLSGCADIFLERSPGEVAMEKYVPPLIWVLPALISLWFPLRSKSYWRWTALTGLAFGLCSACAYLYQTLNWAAVLLSAFVVGLFVVFGGGVSAALILWAGKAVVAAKTAHMLVGMTKAQIDKMAENIEKAKAEGVDAETKFTAKMVPILAFAILGTVVIVAILFGGSVSPTHGKEPSNIDYALRIIGGVLATVSFGFILYDIKHSHWMCTRCERLVWDHGSNKEFCPHPDCGYPNPNPDLKWLCSNKDCSHVNFGPTLECRECHKPRKDCTRFVPALPAEAPEDPHDPDDPADDPPEAPPGVGGPVII